MANLPDGCPEPSEPEFSDLQALADDFRADDTLTRAAEAASNDDVNATTEAPCPHRLGAFDGYFDFCALSFVAEVAEYDTREQILRAVADSCERAARSIRQSLATEGDARRRIWHSPAPAPPDYPFPRQHPVPLSDAEAFALLGAAIVFCGVFLVGVYSIINFFLG